MKWKDWLGSLVIHGMVAGVIAAMGLSRPAPEPEEGSVPIYFEVVDAAALEAAEPESDSGPVPTKQGDSGSVPKEDTDAQECVLPLVTHEDAHAPDDEDAPLQEDASVEEMVNDEGGAAPDGELGDMEEASDPSREKSESPETAREERARVVSDPIALNRIVPVYPRSARRKGHEGRVLVEIAVAASGAVTHAEVVASSGHAELDAAALGATRTARFAPATADGVSVSGRLRLTFDFRLR